MNLGKFRDKTARNSKTKKLPATQRQTLPTALARQARKLHVLKQDKTGVARKTTHHQQSAK